MKFYGIYKITNLVNGKMYIGKHVTSNLDDGYMGSGIVINQALEKYGKENFRKEWLMFCEDEEEMNYMERVFVDQTWIDRSDTYNLKIGGEGGWNYINNHGLNRTPEVLKKISIASAKRRHSEETKAKISQANTGRQSPFKGCKHSEETIKKMSAAHKGHQVSASTRAKNSTAVLGAKNGMYGRHHSEASKEKMRQARYKTLLIKKGII